MSVITSVDLNMISLSLTTVQLRTNDVNDKSIAPISYLIKVNNQTETSTKVQLDSGNPGCYKTSLEVKLKRKTPSVEIRLRVQFRPTEFISSINFHFVGYVAAHHNHTR